MKLPRRMIEEFDRRIRRDPARRGLIAHDSLYGPLCAGHLGHAAAHLAEFAIHVGLVTGFYIPHGNPPAAETDGPLGTLLLAKALKLAGIEVTVLTDENCIGAVTAAAEATRFPVEDVLTYPDGSTDWLDDFFTSGPGRTLSHLISLERVGPSHTPQSLTDQDRDENPPLDHFTAVVPIEAHNRCHNMRGDMIDEHTADMFRLFEQLHRYRPQAKTVGIGDGANEIGMGSIPWEELHRRLDGDHSGRIPCRISTDWTIVTGVSNWGGYALAAAVLLLRDAVHHLRDFDRDHQQRVLEHTVEHGPAVDGVTGRQEATVDGLPFLTYIQPWEGIRRLLGFED